MKDVLNQQEIDRLIWALNQTRTEGYKDISQEKIDLLISILFETETNKNVCIHLLDEPEDYYESYLKLVNNKKAC